LLHSFINLFQIHPEFQRLPPIQRGSALRQKRTAFENQTAKGIQLPPIIIQRNLTLSPSSVTTPAHGFRNLSQFLTPLHTTQSQSTLDFISAMPHLLGPSRPSKSHKPDTFSFSQSSRNIELSTIPIFLDPIGATQIRTQPSSLQNDIYHLTAASTIHGQYRRSKKIPCQYIPLRPLTVFDHLLHPFLHNLNSKCHHFDKEKNSPRHFFNPNQG